MVRSSGRLLGLIADGLDQPGLVEAWKMATKKSCEGVSTGWIHLRFGGGGCGIPPPVGEGGARAQKRPTADQSVAVWANEGCRHSTEGIRGPLVAVVSQRAGGPGGAIKIVQQTNRWACGPASSLGI